MSQYLIHESNFERLEKKLKTIENKCNKYNIGFKFNVIGEEIKEVEIDSPEGKETVSVKYIVVDVEGTVKHNDWTFVAVVDHKEAGNIIRQYVTDLEVPERYYTTDKVCEHCNTRRNRKDTYLVYNEVTGEWKQVGKSCLEEFTNGLSAEAVAQYIAYFDRLIEGEAIPSGSGYERYYPVDEILLYARECVRHFGYWKTDAERSTKERATDYYRACTGGIVVSKSYTARLFEEMREVNFNADTEENTRFVESALEWIASTTDNNSYMHNLRTICSEGYGKYKDLGILVSLISTYIRQVERDAEVAERKQKAADEASVSSHVGNVGDKVKVEVSSFECVYSQDTMYGPCFLYKFVDMIGNVFMWSTSKWLADDAQISSLSGTVKNHDEFKGVKQTFLTRCKVVCA